MRRRFLSITILAVFALGSIGSVSASTPQWTLAQLAQHLVYRLGAAISDWVRVDLNDAEEEADRHHDERPTEGTQAERPNANKAPSFMPFYIVSGSDS